MLIPLDEIPPSGTESRGVWWLRTVGTYCVVMGAVQIFGLLRVLDLLKQGPAPEWPLWLYATSYIYPVSRIAAGMFLLSRSRHAPSLIGVAVLCAANSLFILPAVWTRQIGFEIPYSPLQIVLSRLDFVLMLVVAWAVFRWKAQGLLGSNESVARA